MAATERTEPLRLTNLINMTFNEGTGALAKTHGVNGWNARASSVDFIGGADSPRRGISCRIPPQGPRGHFQMAWWMGLVSAPHGQQQQQTLAQSFDPHCLTYAVCVAYDGCLWVHEFGRNCGQFKMLQSGDYIKVLLNSESPPSIEYHINSDLVYKSKAPIVFPLFPKICAYEQGPLAEDLRWILRDPPASPAGIEDLATRITELEGRIAEMQNQLRICEEEKRDLHAGTEAQQAEIEDLHAGNKQQEKETKAMSDALVAVTKEKAQLLVQLEAAREAVQSASDAKAEVDSLQAAVEEQKKQVVLRDDAVLALKKENQELQMQLKAERDASRAAAEEKALAEEQHKELKAENEARLAALKVEADLKMQLVAKKEAEVDSLQAAVEEQKKQVVLRDDAVLALKKESTELQMQLKAERDASRAAAEEKAGMEAGQALAEQLQKEFSKAIADLQMQLVAERETSQSAAEKKVLPEEQPEVEKAASSSGDDEKFELQVHASQLQRENQALHKAVGALADEKVQLQVEKKEMHAEIQGLRRQLLQSEAWEDVGSSAAASSA